MAVEVGVNISADLPCQRTIASQLNTVNYQGSLTSLLVFYRKHPITR